MVMFLNKKYSIELWGLSTNGTTLSNFRPDVAKVLLSELAMVATSVEMERDRIDSMTIRKAKQRRLLYLFQKDLLPGISGKILNTKVNRENIKVHGAVSISSKVLVYLLVFSSNAAMLFYVFLFALRQTKYRQDAWFRSFLIWISMEVFAVGTVMVLITHVILPSLIMRDIAKIKEKLVESIRDYQRGLATKTATHNADTEERLFNSAEFFFVSSKLAKCYMDLPVAKMISKFRTPWPRQSYHHVVNESQRYDTRFSGLFSSAGTIMFFFIGSFLSIPLGLQDGVLHSMFTVAVGYLVLLHIQLYNIQPALAFIPVFTILVALHFVVLSHRKMITNNVAAVTPIMDEQNNDNDDHAKKIASRRDSIRTGWNFAATAQNYLENSVSSDSLSLHSSELEEFSDSDSPQNQDEFAVSSASISRDFVKIELLSEHNSAQNQEEMKVPSDSFSLHSSELEEFSDDDSTQQNQDEDTVSLGSISLDSAEIELLSEHNSAQNQEEVKVPLGSFSLHSSELEEFSDDDSTQNQDKLSVSLGSISLDSAEHNSVQNEEEMKVSSDSISPDSAEIEIFSDDSSSQDKKEIEDYQTSERSVDGRRSYDSKDSSSGFSALLNALVYYGSEKSEQSEDENVVKME